MLPLFNVLSFITMFVQRLNDQLKTLNAGAELSKTQMLWLGFVISAIIVSNTICWEVFSRMSNKKQKADKLLGIFRRAKIQWDKLLIASTHILLERYQLTEGVLLLDDSDKTRSKNCKKYMQHTRLKTKPLGDTLSLKTLCF